MVAAMDGGHKSAILGFGIPRRSRSLFPTRLYHQLPVGVPPASCSRADLSYRLNPPSPSFRAPSRRTPIGKLNRCKARHFFSLQIQNRPRLGFTIYSLFT